MKNHLLIATAALGSFATGAFIGYKYAEKKLGETFEERLEKETADMRVFYKNVTKKYKTPEEAAAVLIPEEAGKALTEPAKQEPVAYHKIEQKATTVTVSGSDSFKEFTQKAPVERNVFTAPDPLERNPDIPYVITEEEFLENEREYNQVTLTWYAKDDVLCDEHDDIIENDRVSDTIGSDAYQHFGYGAPEDEVHIRNEALQIDFMIKRHQGSYKVDVLGLDDDQNNSGA